MEPGDKGKILVVGCGYIGATLASRLAERYEIWGVTRGEDRHEHLQSIGVNPILTNVTEKGWTNLLPDHFDAIINTVSAGGADYRSVYYKSNCDILEKFRDDPPTVFVYTSSTSVYAQEDGSLVTEDDQTEASTPMREALLDAENVLLEDIYFPSISILRLGGIYGPGRHAYLNDLRSGVRAFPEDPNRWINQIHRDDAIGAIIHAMQMAPRREIFNVVDDEPSHYATCLNWLAKQLGQERPIFDPNAASTRRRGGPKPNRRISNSKIKSTGWYPCHPTFREGFQQIFAEEGSHPIILPPTSREIETGRVA